MNEEAQNALAELERMKQEMAAKLAAVSRMMAQMKPAPQTTDTQKPDEKPSEPAPAESAAEPEQTAPAPEAKNAPQTEPEQTDNKPENEPETEAELAPDEDEQNAAEQGEDEDEDEPDGENAPDAPAEDSGNKEDGEDTKWELKATDPMEEMMLAHLRKTATPELMARIEKKRKTIQGACAFCKDWAMKTCVTKEQLAAGHARGFMGVMGKDEDLLGQMMHYFEEDELDCEPKPAPKPAPYKPAKPYTPPVIPKPAPKKPDPQMTLFDF